MSLLHPVKTTGELRAERDRQLVRWVITSNVTGILLLILVAASLLQGNETQTIERQTQCLVHKVAQCRSQTVTETVNVPVPTPYPVVSPYAVASPYVVVIPSPLVFRVPTPTPVPGPTRTVLVPASPSPAPPAIGCLLFCPPKSSSKKP